MNVEQYHWNKVDGWIKINGDLANKKADLVFLFGSRNLLNQSNLIEEIKNKYLGSIIIGCSTAGEILDDKVFDNTIVATIVAFDKTAVICNSIDIDTADNSYTAGEELIKKFKPEGLKHVFVISDGLNVNGSQLVLGMRNVLPGGVSITGGLAADGSSFVETLVINNGLPINKVVSAIGFYGEYINVNYGSFGGWDSFGIERKVTSSKNNILFELDGQPALNLYKSYLGEHAKSLPSSGLLYPLSVRLGKDQTPIVRTILSVNESDQSLTFAGDIPQGATVRLMKANVDRLINGAIKAAQICKATQSSQPQLALLISCVGRKLVLKQIVEEEVEAVKGILGDNTTITGFYSYGEICPFESFLPCELHNQTMTITTFNELI